jgi:hypothetical protein
MRVSELDIVDSLEALSKFGLVPKSFCSTENRNSFSFASLSLLLSLMSTPPAGERDSEERGGEGELVLDCGGVWTEFTEKLEKGVVEVVVEGDVEKEFCEGEFVVWSSGFGLLGELVSIGVVVWLSLGCVWCVWKQCEKDVGEWMPGEVPFESAEGCGGVMGGEGCLLSCVW